MIVIHEFGHFSAAKFFRVRVEAFSIGLGRRLVGFKWGETDYRLSLIPVGGFVKMSGENLDDARTGEPYEFMSKPKWQRFVIAIAGPTLNILTALIIPAAIAMTHHEVPAYLDKPAKLIGVEPESPAEKAGLQPGDVVVKIDGVENPVWRDVETLVMINADQDLPISVKRDDQVQQKTVRVAAIPAGSEKIGYLGLRAEPTRIVVKDVSEGQPAATAGLEPGDNIVGVNGSKVPQNIYGQMEIIKAIRNSNEQPVTLMVQRDTSQVDIKATPVMNGGELRLGFTQDLAGTEYVNQRMSLIPALRFSIDENVRILQLTGATLGQMFAGKRSARETVNGPIGIFKISGEVARQGFVPVLQLMGLLSLSIGVFNFLPIPMLDGGMMFMLALEGLLGLFGLTLPLRVKERMMQVGFVIVVLLMGFAVFNDISKLVPSRAQPKAEEARPANK
jgi:regulator of sigma E protease